MSNPFDRALTILLLQAPFFGTLALKLKATPRTDIPTACVSARGIEYNPEFVERLPDDQRVFLLAHEVGHFAMAHLTRLRQYVASGVGPDGQPFDAMRYNIALDYIVNAMLVEEKVGARLASALYDRGVSLATHTPELLYNNPPQSGGGQGAMDEHDPSPGSGDSGGDSSSGDPITPQDVMAAVGAAQAMGKHVPNVIMRMVDQMKRPAHDPWKMLRRAVSAARGGADEATWRRLNRRLLVRGFGAPSRSPMGADTVGVIADVSGSIDGPMLALFGSHLASILDTAKPRRMVVYWTDTRVRRRDVVNSTTALKLLLSKPVPGGGGTDMPEGVAAAVADKCDSIVCLTDGYTPWGSPVKTQMVWAITSPGVRAPWGVTVPLKG